MRNMHWKPKHSVEEAAKEEGDDEGYQDTADIFDETLNKGKTTVMLAGLPSSATAENLLSMLEKWFPKTFDFLYVPMDFQTFKSTGWVFINFRLHKKAVECLQHFANCENWGSAGIAVKDASTARCKIHWANVQGYEANLERHQKSEIIDGNIPEDCKPWVFDTQGSRIPTMQVFKPAADTSNPGELGRQVLRIAKSSAAESVHAKTDEWWTNDNWYGDDKPPTANKWKGTDNWKLDNNNWSNDAEKWNGYQSEWKPEESKAWKATNYKNDEKRWKAAEDTDLYDYDYDYEKTGWKTDSRTTKTKTRAEERTWQAKKEETGRAWKEKQREEPESTAKPDAHEEKTSLKADDLFKSAREASLQGAQAPSLPEPVLQGVQAPSLAEAVEESSAPTVLVGGTRYACPGCNQRFAKWSVCQLHIVSSESCQAAVDPQILADADRLQQLCKVVSEAPVAPMGNSTALHKDGAIVTEVRRFQ
mmetsp:Transcript_96158/g.170674  ORF Transcript_96158/g.170674 Transcript_96158/m.170674 type:complete len:476 (-) Transcript_96158:78-1505(-)